MSFNIFKEYREYKAAAAREKAVEAALAESGLPEKCQKCPIARHAASITIWASQEGNHVAEMGLELADANEQLEAGRAGLEKSVRKYGDMAINFAEMELDSSRTLESLAGTAEVDCSGTTMLKGRVARFFTHHPYVCHNPGLLEMTDNRVAQVYLNSQLWEPPEQAA